MLELIITKPARPYLAVQRGDLSDYLIDPALWEKKYNEALDSTYRSIEKYLPLYCAHVVDVGGGIGGIDAVLNDHYQRSIATCPLITIIDGIDDEPVVHRHAQTFNSGAVTRDFLYNNGCEEVSVQTDFSGICPADLIISFASYCFHYPPSTYLDDIKRLCKDDTILIFDVRRNHADWLLHLIKTFRFVDAVEINDKFLRCVFKCEKHIHEVA